ncbi:hypothetical protein SARC_03839 [Sphaeroforma arctica JP610]|uniref:Uncharacterized protein n=1 Tax=Sphaeroforma arctica JP610 TaxID=667725 RepID=A0A0L0G4T3_9EUKA|nr:hypothetical protein SARC_03839 [Sphaeroforma arctica JP610]KNC83924.1 hypothetical protein SARC_03839 [Sphaeroforma arctica JP610]|eukprot:XP_014157826.1 hypothetical protein SARC_03839 [Sphaeroforma arctica JP610]
MRHLFDEQDLEKVASNIEENPHTPIHDHNYTAESQGLPCLCRPLRTNDEWKFHEKLAREIKSQVIGKAAQAHEMCKQRIDYVDGYNIFLKLPIHFNTAEWAQRFQTQAENRDDIEHLHTALRSEETAENATAAVNLAQQKAQEYMDAQPEQAHLPTVGEQNYPFLTPLAPSGDTPTANPQVMEELKRVMIEDEAAAAGRLKLT